MYVDYKHYDREPGAVARRVGASPPPTAAASDVALVSSTAVAILRQDAAVHWRLPRL